MSSSEAEVALIKGELKLVQRALKLQTRRCQQLVIEYTKQLQFTEQQYQAEQHLRDDQLACVLQALLIFEARLRQEQKLISHQLEEKDYTIKKQQSDIQRLLSNHFCKNCNQYYNPGSNLESLDSSSEYVITDYHDYQSSNFESLDSSSETYASIYEKENESRKLPSLNSNRSISSDESLRISSNLLKNNFLKNKNKDSLNRRTKKLIHRKSVGNYFEVLQMRTASHSPSSNEETTCNDYETLDSLSSEHLKSNISSVSERIESIFIENKNKFDSSTEYTLSNNSDGTETSSNITTSNNTTIVNKKPNQENEISSSVSKATSPSTIENHCEQKGFREIKICDTIPVFEIDGETNDNWYASASDQEDDEQRDVYRNNPVLECMNQILMQNINDPTFSPPKSPNMDNKFSKNNKKVKFSDEEDSKIENDVKNNLNGLESDYYETPIQKTPNFYETPQSIYSNDYEQILSQCNQTFQNNITESKFKLNHVERNETSDSFNTTEDLNINDSHSYADMDVKSEKDDIEGKIIRKSKILRTPPALPPKPANLISKYKMQNQTYGISKDKLSEKSFESEPDYCSISEINLPTTGKNGPFNKTSVMVEVNDTNNQLNSKKPNLDKSYLSTQPNENGFLVSPAQYKPVSLNEPIPNLAVKKSIEKINVKIAKQVHTKIDSSTPKKSSSPDIPKLPQVTEIIIPDENESKSEECISHDNYVKNNTQILQQRNNHTDRTHPIQMGSTVSSLIASFNNKQILSEIKQKPIGKYKINKRIFSSFENIQNLETQLSPKQHTDSNSNNFEKFDLSQNFEEFKLDDCEIEDYNETYSDTNKCSFYSEQKEIEQSVKGSHKMLPENLNFNSSTHVEVVRATNNLIKPQLNGNSLQQLKRKLELEKNRAFINNQIKYDGAVSSRNNEPTYEHFLECTGLSSKSILTPSRLLSNHKSMLKPKDVKLRSKIKSNGVLEKQESNTIKYWSEPYL